jgi:hypothetical protein
MSQPEDLRPALKQQATDRLRGFPSAERDALLIQCWMSHDARWFAAAAQECGMPVANRLNQIAARAIGKVEAQRILRALSLPPAVTLDDYLLAQEIFIALLGPDLLDYRVSKVGDRAFQVQVQRCFAYDNVVRAGIAAEYECGVFARITGWLDALGQTHEMNPALGKCLKAQGEECGYTITLRNNPNDPKHR